MRPLAIAPPVVAAAAAGGLVVDFLERVLPDVAENQGAGAAARGVVEAPAPGVAQAEGPDLSAHAGQRARDERVVGGNAVADGIGVCNIDVDAQHLAEQRRRVLRIVVRIVARSAVAHADIEIPVHRREQDVAAVVIAEWLLDGGRAGGLVPPQIEPRRRIRGQWVGRRPLEARDHRIARGVGEVDEETAGGRVRGVERETEQPLFAAAQDRAGEVQEILRLQHAVLDHAHAAALLHHVLNASIGGILDEGHWRGQAGDVNAARELCRGRGRDPEKDRGADRKTDYLIKGLSPAVPHWFCCCPETL